MACLARFAVVVLLGVPLAARGAQSEKLLVDPFPLLFPLVEAGSLDIDGHIVGQPRAQNGVLYYATREGELTATVIPSRSILWRFKADHPISLSPEIAGEAVLLCDDGGVFYAVHRRSGEVIGKTQLNVVATTPVRIIGGEAYVGTAEGKVLGLESDDWDYRPSGPEAPITAGPFPVHLDESTDLILFGRSDGRLIAVDQKGRPAWEFQAGGAVRVDPTQAGGRIYFGDSDRRFYCLDAATGKVKWRHRLQGAPLHPAVVRDGTIAVPASNSVVYFLSARGGSILSWENIPSRVVYQLAAAGTLVLVAGATPDLMAFDMKTCRLAGQFRASRPLVAGVVWSTPHVVLFVDDEESGRQQMVFLRSRLGSQL